MFTLVGNIIFLMNLYVIVQAQDNDSSPPSTSGTTSPTTNIPGINREHILHTATTVQPGVDDIQLNRDAFEPLQNHFGNLGPLMFDVVTSPNALGEEFAKVSKIITSYMEPERYRHSLGTIMELAERIDFADRLKPLFSRISEIRDPKSPQTFGEAVEIITNILSNPKTIEEIQNRITGSNQLTRL